MAEFTVRVHGKMRESSAVAFAATTKICSHRLHATFLDAQPQTRRSYRSCSSARSLQVSVKASPCATRRSSRLSATRRASPVTVCCSLGRVDRLDREQIRRLITALSRSLETGALPEGGRVGQVRDFGLIYLADSLWDRLGLRSFFTKQLRRRRFDAPVERALFALVAHRLVAPSSKLACADWIASDAWLPSPERIRV
jgi:hypothetical protein